MRKFYPVIGLILIAFGIVITVGEYWLGIPIVIFGLLALLKGDKKINQMFNQTTSGLVSECRVLRSCIILYWILFGAALIVSFIEDNSLPTDILQFNNAQIDSVSSWVMGSLIGFLIMNFIASCGIFFLQSWGRSFYVSSELGILILLPFTGTVLVTPISGMLDDTLNILIGVILCLTFFSPAKESFIE